MNGGRSFPSPIVSKDRGQNNHVHGLLEFPPKSAIARAVGIRKRISASRAFARFASLRRTFWSGELWDEEYAARTVGDTVTSALMRRYIKRHTAAQATRQPELL